MTDRERLMNELKRAKNNCLIKESGGCLACTHRGKADCTLEVLADHLLANGVIVPPIKKVGEKLYFHQFNDKPEKVVVEGKIIKIANGEREYIVKLKDERELTFLISFFGKTVFLTKEDAEQALKERERLDR